MCEALAEGTRERGLDVMGRPAEVTSEAVGAEVVLFPEVERVIEWRLERGAEVFGEGVEGFGCADVEFGGGREGFLVERVAQIWACVAVVPEVEGAEIFQPEKAAIRQMGNDFWNSDTAVGEEDCEICVHGILGARGSVNAQNHANLWCGDAEVRAVRSAFQKRFYRSGFERESWKMFAGNAQRFLGGAKRGHGASVRSESRWCPATWAPSVTTQRWS